ncbi:hypothetical protein WG904_12600 [Pedobacter sp. Du54]|uniref:hypothetical protein n=1 Tax=Pedobacter anseongensis TaxID=3133439 RepID=UPI00309666F1
MIKKELSENKKGEIKTKFDLSSLVGVADYLRCAPVILSGGDSNPSLGCSYLASCFIVFPLRRQAFAALGLG